MTIATTPSTELVHWLAGSLGRGGLASDHARDLSPLSCADLEEFAGHLVAADYAGGSLVYARDALPERVHILRTGMVELTRDLAGRDVVVQLLRPGSVFGDVPLFLRTGEPTSARTVEDSTVLSIDSITLFALLGRRPMLARRWLVSVAGRMAEMQDRVSDLLVGGLDRQVASWLLREGTDGGAMVSQLTLSRLLGARRTSVNQALRRLETAGLISTGYRRITVVDVGGLTELVSTR